MKSIHGTKTLLLLFCATLFSCDEAKETPKSEFKESTDGRPVARKEPGSDPIDELVPRVEIGGAIESTSSTIVEPQLAPYSLLRITIENPKEVFTDSNVHTEDNGKGAEKKVDHAGKKDDHMVKKDNHSSKKALPGGNSVFDIFGNATRETIDDLTTWEQPKLIAHTQIDDSPYVQKQVSNRILSEVSDLRRSTISNFPGVCTISEPNKGKLKMTVEAGDSEESPLYELIDDGGVTWNQESVTVSFGSVLGKKIEVEIPSNQYSATVAEGKTVSPVFRNRKTAQTNECGYTSFKVPSCVLSINSLEFTEGEIANLSLDTSGTVSSVSSNLSRLSFPTTGGTASIELPVGSISVQVTVSTNKFGKSYSDSCSTGLVTVISIEQAIEQEFVAAYEDRFKKPPTQIDIEHVVSTYSESIRAGESTIAEIVDQALADLSGRNAAVQIINMMFLLD